jgi:hypothetical protein
MANNVLQSWYGIGVFFIFLRYAVRLRTVGIRGFHGDDYLNIPVGANHLRLHWMLNTESLN